MIEQRGKRGLNQDIFYWIKMDHYNNNNNEKDYKIPPILVYEDDKRLEKEIENFWFEERDKKFEEYNN